MTSEESLYSNTGVGSIMITPDREQSRTDAFTYSSDKNKFLSVEDIRELIKPFMEVVK